MKIGKYYANKFGSRYVPVYVTPEVKGAPQVERWIFLELEKTAFFDFSNPQKFISMPLHLVNDYFLAEGERIDPRKPQV